MKNISPSSVVFQPEKHRYYVGGVRFPSVGEILSDLGLAPPYFGDPFYGKRGTAFHNAVRLLLEEDLDWDSVDERHVLPRLEQWMEWKEEQIIQKLIYIEQPLASIFGYAGTPDLLFQTKDGRFKLPDYKSGKKMKHHQLQIGGYGGLIHEQFPGIELEMEIVYFDGSKNKAKTEQVPPNCIDLFRSAAKIYSWKNKK